MENNQIPIISISEIREGIDKANTSERRRFPKILHNPGDEFNRVINFMMNDSYMQPHLHPGVEKIEKIYILEGRIAVFFFDDSGEIIKTTILEKGGIEIIAVPAFTWHTYAMLTEYAITYETMMGKYDPQTWKNFFSIAPEENALNSQEYLQNLQKVANTYNQSNI
jgi:cupin fold WbuC family metalloprotein